MRSNHTRAKNIINKTFSNQACSEPVRLYWQLIFLLVQSRDDTYNDIVIDNGTH